MTIQNLLLLIANMGRSSILTMANMDTERQAFIQELVAALLENSQFVGNVSPFAPSQEPTSIANPTSKSESDCKTSDETHTGFFLSRACTMPIGDRERLARDAYVQLQFDFPQVPDASIEALAELYRRISAETSMSQTAAEVPVTTALLDSLVFSNNYEAFSSTRDAKRFQHSEASGLLAASLLLLIFRTCLETPGDARAEALLSPLVMKKAAQTRNFVTNTKHKTLWETVDEEKVEEKFAAQEDPDDLSEVYLGHSPERQAVHFPARNQEKEPTSVVSREEQLRYFVSLTFSSSFQNLSAEKWEQWCLDEHLVAIIMLLVDRAPFQDAGDDNADPAPMVLYGPRGAWSRYLYLLRDHILRFPGASHQTLRQLKELMGYFKDHQFVSTTTGSLHRCFQQPKHMVLRVLRELAISREFRQSVNQRAQQSLVLVIQELIPLLTMEVHQLISAPSAAAQNVSERRLEEPCGEDDGEDELLIVVLQLLRYVLFASSDGRRATTNFYESGMLRTLLMLLPQTSNCGYSHESPVQERRWFSPLFRLFGECALWHDGFAAYIARVPKFISIYSTLQEHHVVEKFLLALAFHQHDIQVQMSSHDVTSTVSDVLTSNALFPLHCKSYLDAIQRDTMFVLNCLAKVLATLKPAMQKDLEQSLRKVLTTFTRSFVYPTFCTSADQQQDQSLIPPDDGKVKVKKDEDRAEAEFLHFTTLRNKLRQRLKSLLAALCSNSTLTYAEGRASSKLD
ncbi:hypothetical protein PsorP6_010565 [Peronosclerospora sorghi]|uniref:Uncharacterized protein n=1 Tax=Peronosclerospora sorghi TaxID=230839 RepID=A0ACC0VXG8_9STRA|nr:hypothetical protein PsorP6_010565 [Peronosclerospora sorghi]